MSAQFPFSVWRPQLLDSILWEIDLMVKKIGTLRTNSGRIWSAAHKTKEPRIRACTQGDDLLLLSRVMGKKSVDEIVNGLCSNIGTCVAWSTNTTSFGPYIYPDLVPLFMIGNLLCDSDATKYLANGSSRYPTSTALSLETLAS